MDKFFYIGLTLFLTVYGQIIIKARAIVHASNPSSRSKIDYLVAMYTDPGVISGLGAALLASIFWALAVSNAGISLAYPFMALSFVIVPLMAHLLFNEAIAPMQIVGLFLIVAGIAINAIANNG